MVFLWVKSKRIKCAEVMQVHSDYQFLAEEFLRKVGLPGSRAAGPVSRGWHGAALPCWLPRVGCGRGSGLRPL